MPKGMGSLSRFSTSSVWCTVLPSSRKVERRAKWNGNRASVSGPSVSSSVMERLALLMSRCSRSRAKPCCPPAYSRPFQKKLPPVSLPVHGNRMGACRGQMAGSACQSISCPAAFFRLTASAPWVETVRVSVPLEMVYSIVSSRSPPTCIFCLGPAGDKFNPLSINSIGCTFLQNTTSRRDGQARPPGCAAETEKTAGHCPSGSHRKAIPPSFLGQWVQALFSS